jgi:hypothetical protein
MTQHDSFAAGQRPWHSRDGRSAEVPDPGSVPADWSPSSGYPGYPMTTGAPGWSGRQPEWNDDTAVGAHVYGAGPVPDRVPAEWNDPAPPSWNTPSRHAAPEPAGWGIGVDHARVSRTPAGSPVVVRPQPAPPTVTPDQAADRSRKNPKLMMAVYLAAAALAGGGVGAGLMVVLTP